MKRTIATTFTRNHTAGLGYRYMDTDHFDGTITYDIAQACLCTSLNIKL